MAIRVAHRVIGDSGRGNVEGSRVMTKVVGELVSDERILAHFVGETVVKQRTAMHVVLWNW